MKKRISLLVCVLVSLLSFAGCSGKDTSIQYEEASLERVTEAVIGSFSQMGEEDFRQFEELSEYQLEYTMMQSGLPIKGEDFLGMIGSWNAAEDECGSYVTHGAYEFEVSGDGITVSSQAEYENRDADIVFKFDEDLNLVSMDVSAKYTTGEILKKAGLNTVLGMGTVFVVLIFLSFIISLFKYIPNGDKKAKKEAKTEEKASVVAAATEEDVTDDLELVAVITAAIAASEGTSSDGFVVRSIKRRKTNKWN